MPIRSLSHPRGDSEHPHPILSGWKDIASYLGRGVRTVQRYEHDRGLPVRRPAGKARGSVIATKDEIDAWVTARPIREPVQMPRLVLHDAPLNELRRQLNDSRELRQQNAMLRGRLHETVVLLEENLRCSLLSERSSKAKHKAIGDCGNKVPYFGEVPVPGGSPDPLQGFRDGKPTRVAR